MWSCRGASICDNHHSSAPFILYPTHLLYIMSDSQTKSKAGVPSWQRQAPAEAESKKEDKVELTEEPLRTELIESAKKFLEEDEVRDATTDKKIAFLESKGLKSEEIEQLLGVARNVEASNPASKVCFVTSSRSSISNSVKPVTRTVIPTQQSIIQQSSPTSSPPTPQPQAAPEPQRDNPPIITYPEFLTTPQAPPPLITPTRVLNTLYAFSGLGALIYGASTYLIKPMSENLASARHELAETAQEKLNTLNDKLKPMVSELPLPVLAHGEARDKEEEEDDDPTEMFHRDIGVQTSPSLDETPIPEEKPLTVNAQTSKSQLISLNLNEVELALSQESHAEGTVQTEINSLKTYLDTLMYTAPSFTYGGGMQYGKKPDEDDEIGRIKKEIRAVKGVLLSTKNFPVGAGMPQYRRPA